ncbi:MAG: SurA N-terminal domain-containing protein [Bacteroidales bacterium]|nr:SurA N-terminal domain-containing protein [Bacteroidales bacterium]
MATLEKIRNRAGVLVAVVIGVALLAFILGDFFNSGGALFSNSQFEIAEISGKSIPYQKYQKELNDIMEITKFSSGESTLDETATERIRQQTWTQMVREYVLEDEYDELGVNISSQELWDMVQGENIHPIIRNLFTNPETGELNSLAVIQFLKSYDQDPTGQRKAYWLFIEDQMVQERMFTKYLNLVSKGLYSTKAEAKSELSYMNKKVDFEFVFQDLHAIPDSIVEISTNELKEYYNYHQSDYKQMASRAIEYITFDVVASEEDKKVTEEWINNVEADFANTQNDIEFAHLNSDLPVDNAFYKQDELPENLRDIMFNEKEGFIYGPYFENETYYLAKLSEINYLPDSVKAKHILIQPTRNESSEQVYALADSLVSLLKSGTSFATLSEKFSTDNAANEKGGDLGWFRANQMVSPFSDTCFSAKTGEYKLVATQFGLHIVQVTDKAKNEKKVKLAILGRKLQPGSETYQKTYAKASKFAGNNQTYDEFIKAIEVENLTKKVATNIKESDQQFAGLEYPRELIRSIYNTDNKQIITSQNNPIFELGNRFVIGFVTEVKEDGFAPFEQVEPQVLVQVKKQKKADLLADKFNEILKDNPDLDNLAGKLNTEIYEATDINFRSYSVPNAGIEPKVIAVVTAMEQGQISGPVKGNNGVFVLKVIAVSVDESVNNEIQQMQMMTQFQNRANYEAFEALKENAVIIDKRAKFY